MNLIDTKSLEKLAKVCRKMGIKHFKSAEFEFTLTDDLPEETKAPGKRVLNEVEALALTEIQTEEPTQEDLLFWSSGAIIDKNGES